MQPHQTPQWREERGGREGREESIDRLDDMGTGVEFYPVDPLSRGMMDRLRVLNMSMSVSNMVYLPYEDVDDAQYQRSSHSREKYQVGQKCFCIFMKLTLPQSTSWSLVILISLFIKICVFLAQCFG